MRAEELWQWRTLGLDILLGGMGLDPLSVSSEKDTLEYLKSSELKDLFEEDLNLQKLAEKWVSEEIGNLEAMIQNVQNRAVALLLQSSLSRACGNKTVDINHFIDTEFHTEIELWVTNQTP